MRVFIILLLFVFSNDLAFGKDKPLIQTLLSDYTWTEVFEYHQDLKGKKLHKEYDHIFIANELFNWSDGLIIRPSGQYGTEYSPQCGTGPQFWWDIYGTWKLVKYNIIALTFTEESLGYINLTTEEVEELEKNRKANPTIGETSYYRIDYLENKFLCLKKVEKP